MLRSSIAAAALLILGLAAAAPAWASWPTSPATDLTIPTGPGTVHDVRAVSDGAEGAIVAWLRWLPRCVNPCSFDSSYLEVQRVLPNGAVMTWGANGRVLAHRDAEWIPASPDLAMDGTGGAFVVWERYGYNSGSSDGVWVQRLSGNGQPLWMDGGVRVSPAGAAGNFPCLAGDGMGGAFVVWFRGSTGIRAQHLGPDGASLWPDTGVVVSDQIVSAPYTGSSRQPRLVPDGAGGAYFVWPTAEGVRWQHLDAMGAPLWEPNGRAVPADDTTPSLVADEAGGAFVVATDGVYGSPPYTLVLQHVLTSGDTTGGTTRLTVGSNGFGAPDGAGGVAAMSLSGTSSGQWAVVRRSSADALPWGTGVLAGPGIFRWEARVVPLPGGDLLATWPDIDTGGGRAVAQRFSGSGTPVWAPGGVEFARRWSDNVHALPTTAGGVLIVSGEPWISLKRLSSDGVLGSDGLVDAPMGGMRSTSALAPPSPNPSAGAITFAFTLAEPGRARLEIHDVAGRRARLLANEVLRAGSHAGRWDGRDERGRKASPGLYFAVLRTERGDFTRRVVISR